MQVLERTKSVVVRAGAATGVGIATIAGGASLAGATTPATPAEVVGGGAESLSDNLMEVATTVLPYAAGLVAVLLGWRLARRFISA